MVAHKLMQQNGLKKLKNQRAVFIINELLKPCLTVTFWRYTMLTSVSTCMSNLLWQLPCMIPGTQGKPTLLFQRRKNL